ncbi:MAG TPA: hypothetical protein VLM79_14200, partial [Kofleriaceae bacterium]|nr:hypothetical protein [Kofleriaceae bacterium]
VQHYAIDHSRLHIPILYGVDAVHGFGRFGAALADARKGLEDSATDDAGWVRAQRFEIAWRALELAVLLGRAHELADLIVARFLLPDPPLLDSNAALVPFRVPAVCALASAPRPCFARFRALREQLPGAITQDTDDFMTGAERYASGDPAGAARAWRPLLAGRMTLASVLPGAMADVFDRIGADPLAEQLDAEVMSHKGELNGATLGHVRAAHRALRRGDRATALRLADEVIAAWQFADEVPPALADMQKLAAQLRR